MKEPEHSDRKDDGRVIADMSAVERTPLMIPRVRREDGVRKQQEREEPSAAPQQSFSLEREERRAVIRGALHAGLLVGVVLFASFAALILLISFLWG